MPLWGVWADKYSRKAVIVRSALVEAVVFACVALSQEPWQLALSLLLIGFQLGNTGVMLAGIRDVAPLARIGTVIAIFGVAGPIGWAVGPILAAFLVDVQGWSLSAVFWSSAVLSVATALLVAVGSREVRPSVVPEGRVLALAYGAVRGVLGDPAIRRIFAIYFVTLPREPADAAVPAGDRRGPRRDRARAGVGDRARARDRGAGRCGRGDARRGVGRPARVPAGAAWRRSSAAVWRSC